jgi:hypothetical protein
MPKGNVSLEDLQPELPPVFTRLRDQIAAARKMLLKDAAFGEVRQLRQFIAQYVLPLMETTTTLSGGAFVDTYSLAASNHEEIERIHKVLDDEDGGGGGVDLDDLNDLQKAFFSLGSVIQSPTRKDDVELQTAYAATATALAEFVRLVVEDARDEEDARDDDTSDGEPDTGGDA